MSKPPIEVPHLSLAHDIINKHMSIVDSDSPPNGPSINDELEILIHLMGISRLIEYNMRVGYERLNIKGKLGLPEPFSFKELIADFSKVYSNTKAAYDIDDLSFDQKAFNPPVVYFESTITKNGLNLVVEGDEATTHDSKGNPTPTKTLKPDGTNEIHIDFKYYYLTGAFGFTWDVLKLCYSESVVFKRDMTES